MRLHTNVLKWGNKYEGPNDYKHGRQGALDDAFWPEDELVDHRSTKKKNRKAKSKTRAGCPETDYKAHVYVWTTQYENDKHLFYQFYGYHKWEREICAGCGKKRKSQVTEKYRRRKDKLWNAMPNGLPRSRGQWRGYSYNYWSWETYDKDYQEFIRHWKTLHPNNPYNYNYYSTFSW